MVVNPPKELSEWGNMRANSSDAAVLASKYCYLAGFDSTSNILAGKKFNIPIQGTYRTFINTLQNGDILKKLEPRVCYKESILNFMLFCHK